MGGPGKHRPPANRALHTLRHRPEHNSISRIPRRILREFAGIGHQHTAGHVFQDRRDDHAGVGDDGDAACLSDVRKPLASISSARGGRCRRRRAWKASFPNQRRQLFELRPLQVRAADGDGVDMVCTLGGGEAALRLR